MVIENQPKDIRDLERSEIWKSIGPLVIRGGGVEEILNIASGPLFSLDRKQVKNAVDTAKQRSLVGVTTYIRIVKMKDDNSKDLLAQDLDKKISFARGLFEDGLIPPRHECVEEMMEFCKDNKIVMPRNFYDMLRLEMYYSAVTLAHMGDVGRFKDYIALGNRVDPEWFVQSLVEEEMSIMGALNKKWSSSRNRNPRWKEAVGVDNWDNLGIMLETPEFALRRQKTRWGIVDRSPDKTPRSKGGRH